MIQTFDLSYPSSDGIHAVHAREWVPEGAPRGVVQLVHGVAEHIGRYDQAARFLAAHGYVVCGQDHLGHGLTAGGKFGYFGPKNGWDLVARDVRRLRELEGEKHPSLPYVILGHSMGSFLTRTYLIRWPGTVDAAVLSGTGQESAAAVASGKALAGAMCKLRGPDHVKNANGDPGLFPLRRPRPGGLHGQGSAEGGGDVPCRGVQGRHRKALPRRPPRDVQRDQPPGGLPGPAGLAGKQTDMIQGEGRPLSLFFPE